MSYLESIENNPLRRDCHRLAVEAVKVCRQVQSDKREYEVSRQFTRAAVSIGSNLMESQGSTSDEMAASKLEIAYRECCEARFQLSVLCESGLLDAMVAEDLDEQIDSLAARLYTGMRRLRQRAHDTPSNRFNRFEKPPSPD